MNRRPITATKTAALLGISVRTLKRRAVDPADDLPKPATQNGHMVWCAKEIERYIENLFSARDKQQAEIRQALLRAAS
jgi:predicted DNA-binding transcriptional regulator AlpA